MPTAASTRHAIPVTNPTARLPARSSRKPPGTYTKDSPERSIGKTCDLAFGYQGGFNAWRKFEPERFTDEEVEQFKKEWRAAHPNIKRFWHDIDRAAWTAVRERGRVVSCGRVAFKCSGAFLFLKLPSGRKLAYPQPHIEIEDARQSGRCLRGQRCRAIQGLPSRQWRLWRLVDRKRRLRHSPRSAR